MNNSIKLAIEALEEILNCKLEVIKEAINYTSFNPTYKKITYKLYKLKLDAPENIVTVQYSGAYNSSNKETVDTFLDKELIKQIYEYLIR